MRCSNPSIVTYATFLFSSPVASCASNFLMAVRKLTPILQVLKQAHLLSVKMNGNTAACEGN